MDMEWNCWKDEKKEAGIKDVEKFENEDVKDGWDGDKGDAGVKVVKELGKEEEEGNEDAEKVEGGGGWGAVINTLKPMQRQNMVSVKWAHAYWTRF